MELSCRRIIELADKVMDGQEITRTEAMELIHTSDADTMVLLAMADKIRQKFKGNGIDFCAIVNARSGHCPENCRSVHSPVSGIPEPGYTACFRKNRLWIWPGRPEMLVLFVFLL